MTLVWKTNIEFSALVCEWKYVDTAFFLHMQVNTSLMNTFAAFLFSLSITFGICNGSLPNGSFPNGSIPDGYLLGISVIKDVDLKCENISLFKIDFTGTVTKLWNFSLANPDILFTFNLFAVNPEKGIVYLGSRDHYLALDMMTGAVKIKINLAGLNKQYFWNYHYVIRDDAIYGVCTGKGGWDWCRMKQTGHYTAHLEFLYELPDITAISPIISAYYMDTEEQTMWYYPFLISKFAVGINYTTGKEVFRSAENPNSTLDVCIVRDHELNRVFTYVQNNLGSVAIGIGELFRQPKEREMLIDFSQLDRRYLHYSSSTLYGACAYDQSTHTMIGLVGPTTANGATYQLLLVDVIKKTPKLIPLPEFKIWNNPPLANVKFLPK